MNLGIIIQARINSTRFPEKIIKHFINEDSILDILIKRLKGSFPEIPIVIATGDHIDNLKIKSISQKYGVPLFIGSENNVLDRFVKCAELYDFNRVVRICSDNPFLDMNLLKKLIDNSQDDESDYWSYSFRGTPVIRTHFGIFCEIVRVSALIKVSQFTTDNLYLEHVTNFIYQNEKIFNCSFLNAPEELEVFDKIRLTIDTEKDFIVCQDIMAELIKKNDILSFDYRYILQLIYSNPQWIKSMETQKILNLK